MCKLDTWQFDEWHSGLVLMPFNSWICFSKNQ